MEYKFRDCEIYYKFIDRKRVCTNVFLHGWGCSHKQWFFCEEFLKRQNSLYIDFPPFGNSKGPPSDWTVFTYANMVISLCEKLGIKRWNLIGHSFGGRISIIIAVLCKQETNKLVLVDSAGLKPRRSLKYYFKGVKYKIKKRLGIDVSGYGSADYRKLSSNMKKVFVNVVNIYLDEFLPFIKQPTLILFGMNDKETPVYMAKKFKSKIKNSKLILFENAGHFCFLDKKIEFLTNLKNFL